MSKVRTLILLMFFWVISNASCQQYEFEIPTDEQIWSGWYSLSYEARTEILRDYFIADHSTPIIIFPEYTAILTDQNDLFISALNDQPINITLHKFSYEAEAPVWIFEDFIKPANEWPNRFIAAGIGLAVGIFGTITIFCLSK